VFGQQGASASTEDVAALAGVGIATVFRHFPTKQALLEAIVLSRLEAMLVSAREIARRSDDTGFFDLFRAFVGEAGHKRVFGDVLTGASEDFRNANRVIVDELWAIFAQLTSRGQAAGKIRADIDIGDVRALLTGAHQAVHAIGDDPVRQQRLADMLLAGVRP
jgi:AcrR family transcriptional regulator